MATTAAEFEPADSLPTEMVWWISILHGRGMLSSFGSRYAVLPEIEKAAFSSTYDIFG
jgi:hypothetical protein